MLSPEPNLPTIGTQDRVEAGTRWQPIETAPKDIVRRYDNAEYGAYILLYGGGDVYRGRWWQSADPKSREEGYHNFLADGGRAVRPTHWMPLPSPPEPPA